MYNKLFYIDPDKLKLLDAKKELSDLKNSASSVASKKGYLTGLLKDVAKLVKTENTKPDCVAAAWLLLADIYGSLSRLHCYDALDKADKALDQAIKCIDQYSFILQESLDGTAGGLDLEFIMKCNTFNVADVDEALILLREHLLPHLKSCSEKIPLFTTTEVAAGAGLDVDPPDSSKTGPS